MKRPTFFHNAKILHIILPTKKTNQANASSTESEDELQTVLVNSQWKSSHEDQQQYSSSTILTFSNVLLSIVYVSLLHNTGKQLPMRAFLDSASQASFITEAKTKPLIPPLVKVQTTIVAPGSSKTQKTPSVIVMKINHAVETVLHLTPKNLNELRTQPTDVTQFLHANNLNFSHRKFNVSGNIDILLGVDVLGEGMLDN